MATATTARPLLLILNATHLQMKLNPIDSYTKEELYNLLQQDEIKISSLQQEINDIMETIRLCNVNRGTNTGTIINNYAGDGNLNQQI